MAGNQSAYATYHVLTERVDHHRTTRTQNPEERASRQFQSQWFALGARLKAKTWDLALAVATST